MDENCCLFNSLCKYNWSLHDISVSGIHRQDVCCPCSQSLQQTKSSEQVIWWFKSPSIKLRYFLIEHDIVRLKSTVREEDYLYVALFRHIKIKDAVALGIHPYGLCCYYFTINLVCACDSCHEGVSDTIRSWQCHEWGCGDFHSKSKLMMMMMSYSNSVLHKRSNKHNTVHLLIYSTQNSKDKRWKKKFWVA